VKLTQILLIGILLLASLLRFYKLDTIPHGLYIDEVSIGYNAYTILTKGADEYGVSYPLFFKAFGEYKMPVAVYLTSASMAVFGKSEFAVRFPSALLGTISVLLLYFLVRILFKDNRTAIVSAFLLAISPWHIQFSRGGFEANIALFFYLLGAVFFLQYRHRRQIMFLILSVFCFVTTIYTYNAYKVIAPLTIIFVILNSFQHLRRSRNKFGMTQLFVVCLSLLIVLLPVLLFSGGNNRFLEASAFSEYTRLPLVQKIMIYPMLYFKNYLSFFSLPFLFVTNDGFGRHTIEGMGPLFRWESPFLLFGFFALFKQRKEFFAKTIWFLLLVAPMAAALTLPSPHALRSLLLVVPLTILTAYGIVTLWMQKSRVIKIVVLGIALFAVYECSLYLHLYYVHYPSRTALDWGGEYKQVILEAQKQQKQYSHIVINSSIGMIPSYSNFYDPSLKYEFVGYNWQKPAAWKGEKVLYITPEDVTKDYNFAKTPHTHLKNIYFSNLNHDTFAVFWEL